MQLPAVFSVKVVPLTEQTDCVEDEKLTARLELAVAERVKVLPAVCVAIVGNVSVCVWPFTLMVKGTVCAAAYWLLPPCEALIVQVPLAINDAIVPETVQVAGVAEVKVTANPEVAVAVKANVDQTVSSALDEVMVMVCGGRGELMTTICPCEAGPYVLLPA